MNATETKTTHSDAQTAADILAAYRAIRLDPTTGNPVARSEAFVNQVRLNDPVGAARVSAAIASDVQGFVVRADLPPGALLRIARELVRP